MFEMHTVNKSDTQMKWMNEVNITNLFFLIWNTITFTRLMSVTSIQKMIVIIVILTNNIKSVHKVVSDITFYMSLSTILWDSFYLFSVEIKNLWNLS